MGHNQATNDEGGGVNVAFDYNGAAGDLGREPLAIPEAAKRLKRRGQPWALVVDENYGEGSAREHAAMQPRFLGCAMIIARSFARYVSRTYMHIVSLSLPLSLSYTISRSCDGYEEYMKRISK